MAIARGPAAVAATVCILACTAVRVHAAEGGFLEMLFGVHPAPQQETSAPAQADAPLPARRTRLGSGRHTLRTRYAALPVRIHVNDRQTPLDMSRGAAAALMRDETLRPGDIVVLNTGAKVFTGERGRQHAMSDFEPVQRSAYVDRKTRTLLAGMMRPAGALPADEARRMVARLRKAAPAKAAPVARSAEMRVINPWGGER